MTRPGVASRIPELSSHTRPPRSAISSLPGAASEFDYWDINGHVYRWGYDADGGM
jgi:hypothetical protein